MTIRSLTAICLATVALTGCQAMVYGTAADLNRVAVGMDKSQVVAAMGVPTMVSADAAKREEKLTFKKMAQTAGMWPHLYEVTLIDGKVARYGEVQ